MESPNFSIENTFKQDPEQTETIIPVEVEYELTDPYGGNAEKFKTNSFELNDTHSSRIFDGYIHTPEGDFAFQGPVEKAQQVLRDIKKYCLAFLQKRSLEVALSNAFREREAAANRFRLKNDEAPLTEAMEKVDKIMRQKSSAERELNILKEKVSEYR